MFFTTQQGFIYFVWGKGRSQNQTSGKVRLLAGLASNLADFWTAVGIDLEFSLILTVAIVGNGSATELTLLLDKVLAMES